MEAKLNEVKINEKEQGINVMKLLWKMMCYKPGLYAVNCLLWVCIHVEPLILGLIIKVFFDEISGKAKLNIGVWGVVAMTLAYAFARMVNIYFGARVDIFHRFNMSALLRRNILEGILKKPGACDLPCSSGEALNCFRDDAGMIEDVISWTLDVIGCTVFAVTAICILLTVNLKITLLVFTPLVAVIGIVQSISTRLQKYRKAARNATGMVTGAMGEIFGAIQAIKVDGAEERVVNHLNKLNKKRHKMMLKDTLLMQLMDSLFQNTVSIGTGFILLLAAGSMRSGNFTIGDFSLFVYYLNFVADFTHMFGAFLARNKQAQVAFKRMLDLMEENSEDALVKHNKLHLYPDQAKSYEAEECSSERIEELNGIEVKGLSYTYPSSGMGIKNIDFSLKRGSFTVITGRIGSGKSTLIKVLLGLLPKDAGNVYWNGSLIEDQSTFFIPPYSAYTPQIPNLISDTVINNILFGLSKEEVDVDKALYSAVLEDDLKKFDEGLETVIGPKGVKLSGGQIQRMAAARMFARKAELMVFDDISSALDVETEKKLWTRLSEENYGACLVVSNRRRALQKADHIIVMKDGSIEAEGNLEELLETSSEMQKIWGI